MAGSKRKGKSRRPARHKPRPQIQPTASSRRLKPWVWPVAVVVVLVVTLGGSYLFGWWGGASSARQFTARRGAGVKNVLIFLVDTLRADHLGCHGYYRSTSPNIDNFAAESVLFERAYSVSPWTRTSVVSMFSSMYPVAHACQDREDIADEDLVMMAEIFKANGFRTGGFSTNVSVSAQFGCAQGFDEFTYFDRKPWFAARPGRPDPGYVPIEGMMPETLAFLEGVGDDPFFLYFHCSDPHAKYLPPQEFALWGSQQINRYDGEIRYVDHYFQELIDHLRRTDKLDETLVIFTADHGEELYDHGEQGHGHTLYNELLEVPLIVRHPRFSPARRSEIVRLVDVLPTLIEVCGLEPQNAVLQGRTLVPLLEGGPDPEPEQHFVFGEIMYPSKIEGLSFQTEGWKFIETFQARRSPQRMVRDVGPRGFCLPLVHLTMTVPPVLPSAGCLPGLTGSALNAL